MPRSTTVTVTAAAVTLACLGASLYASPPVVAETMGRQVQAFAPLKPDTSPGPSSTQNDQIDPLGAEGRKYSTPVSPANEPTALAAAEPTSRLIDEVTLTPVTVASGPEADRTADSPTSSSTARPTDEIDVPESTVEPTADEAEQNIPVDLDSPDSMTVIVNKLRPLPADYEPDDLVELPFELGAGTYSLREDAAEAAAAMFAAAEQDGISLTVVSAYRSYDYQAELYDDYVRQYGTAATNAMSAQPGYSEHQTGLALDVDTPQGQYTLQQSFGDTAAGQWLAERAHEFGFVIRYPRDEYNYTGFQYEPWHLRYFGEPYAQHLVEHSGVAERDFGLDPAPDYAG